MIARISLHPHPGRLAAVRRHHAHPRARIGFTNLRISKSHHLRIIARHIVDHVHLLHALFIHLPVGDPFAVRTPAESVA